jgi:hypothetical protein
MRLSQTLRKEKYMINMEKKELKDSKQDKMQEDNNSILMQMIFLINSSAEEEREANKEAINSIFNSTLEITIISISNSNSNK